MIRLGRKPLHGFRNFDNLFTKVVAGEQADEGLRRVFKALNDRLRDFSFPAASHWANCVTPSVNLAAYAVAAFAVDDLEVVRSRQTGRTAAEADFLILHGVMIHRMKAEMPTAGFIRRQLITEHHEASVLCEIGYNQPLLNQEQIL